MTTNYHPAFDMIERRIEAGDYIVKSDAEWFLRYFDFWFGTGVFKGIKFKLSYSYLEGRGWRIETYAHPGFMRQSQHIDDVPEDIEKKLIAIAQEMLDEQEAKNDADCDARKKHALDTVISN